MAALSPLQTESVDPARDPAALLRPRRSITGISAILLPFTDSGEIDWPGFEAHVARTLDAELAPAVNMDTGYVNLIDDATRQAVLARTQAIAAGREFVAGAFVADQPGAAWNRDAYARPIEQIQRAGGTPVIFQSFGLTGQPSSAIVAAYARCRAPRSVANWPTTACTARSISSSVRVAASLLSVKRTARLFSPGGAVATPSAPLVAGADAATLGR